MLSQWGPLDPDAIGAVLVLLLLLLLDVLAPRYGVDSTDGMNAGRRDHVGTI